jgi:serine O-acetyltransferase
MAWALTIFSFDSLPRSRVGWRKKRGIAMRKTFDCGLKRQLPNLVESVMRSIHDTPKINHVEKQDLPSRKVVLAILEDLESLVFPGYVRHDLCGANLPYFVGDTLDGLFVRLREEVAKALIHDSCVQLDPRPIETFETEAEEMTLQFLERVPEVRRLCETDVQAAFEGDPAAKSYAEVIFAYPGFDAIATYRLAHELHIIGVPIIPRFMTETAHQRTGIDIHPGATIGEGFFIDHGTGVVIGETTEIGERVQMYHGVTLGAFSPRKGQAIRGTKRHPTIESHVTIYPNATILGGETVVGTGSVIGGNVWLTESVPPNSRVAMEPPAQTILQKDNG